MLPIALVAVVCLLAFLIARKPFRSQSASSAVQVAPIPSSRTALKNAPPVETKHLVADAVFNQVGGKDATSISVQALSDHLVSKGGAGGLELVKLQSLFSQLDTDADGTVDRQEWRVGFTAGVVS